MSDGRVQREHRQRDRQHGKTDSQEHCAYAPYLAWSTYAAALNLEIWRRNRS